MKKVVFLMCIMRVCHALETLFSDNSFYKHSESSCLAAVQNCTIHRNVTLLEDPTQPAVFDEFHSSTFAEFLSTPIYSFQVYNTTAIVDEKFLETLSLLYNHPQQMHLLLALARDTSTDVWINMIKEYESCFIPMVYTCINDTCNKFDTKYLLFEPNIFTENVIAFEFEALPQSDYNQSPFNLNMTIVLHLSNNETGVEKFIRYDYSSLAIFDAILSSLRYFVLRTKVKFPLLLEMEEYNRKLPYRAYSPVLLIRGD